MARSGTGSSTFTKVAQGNGTLNAFTRSVTVPATPTAGSGTFTSGVFNGDPTDSASPVVTTWLPTDPGATVPAIAGEKLYQTRASDQPAATSRIGSWEIPFESQGIPGPQGIQGTPSTVPGPPGVNAQNINLLANRQTFIFANSTQTLSTDGDVTVVADMQGTYTSAQVWSVISTDDAGTETTLTIDPLSPPLGYTFSTTDTTEENDTLTFTNSVFSNNATLRVIVNRGNAVDSLIIYKIINGENGVNGNPGLDGDDGADAVSILIFGNNVLKNVTISTELMATAYAGGIAFSEAIHAGAAFFYTWSKDGTPVSGETNRTITVLASGIGDNVSSEYSCEVTRRDTFTNDIVFQVSGAVAVSKVIDGEDGLTSRRIYMDSPTQPATPVGGSPTGWLFQPTEGIQEQRWFSDGIGNEQFDSREVSTVEFNGISGSGSPVAGVKEEGFFDISGMPGDSALNLPESTAIIFNGVTGEQTTTNGNTEEGFFDISGIPGDNGATSQFETTTFTCNGITTVTEFDPTHEEGYLDINGTPGENLVDAGETTRITFKDPRLSDSEQPVPAQFEATDISAVGISGVGGSGSVGLPEITTIDIDGVSGQVVPGDTGSKGSYTFQMTAASPKYGLANMVSFADHEQDLGYCRTGTCSANYDQTYCESITGGFWIGNAHSDQTVCETIQFSEWGPDLDPPIGTVGVDACRGRTTSQTIEEWWIQNQRSFNNCSVLRSDGTVRANSAARDNGLRKRDTCALLGGVWEVNPLAGGDFDKIMTESQCEFSEQRFGGDWDAVPSLNSRPLLAERDFLVEFGDALSVSGANPSYYQDGVFVSHSYSIDQVTRSGGFFNPETLDGYQELARISRKHYDFITNNNFTDTERAIFISILNDFINGTNNTFSTYGVNKSNTNTEFLGTCVPNGVHDTEPTLTDVSERECFARYHTYTTSPRSQYDWTWNDAGKTSSDALDTNSRDPYNINPNLLSFSLKDYVSSTSQNGDSLTVNFADNAYTNAGNRYLDASNSESSFTGGYRSNVVRVTGRTDGVQPVGGGSSLSHTFRFTGDFNSSTFIPTSYSFTLNNAEGWIPKIGTEGSINANLCLVQGGGTLWCNATANPGVNLTATQYAAAWAGLLSSPGYIDEQIDPATGLLYDPDGIYRWASSDGTANKPFFISATSSGPDLTVTWNPEVVGTMRFDRRESGFISGVGVVTNGIEDVNGNSLLSSTTIGNRGAVGIPISGGVDGDGSGDSGSFDSYVITIPPSHNVTSTTDPFEVTGTFPSGILAPAMATQVVGSLTAALGGSIQNYLVEDDLIQESFDFSFNDITIAVADFDNLDQIRINSVLDASVAGTDSIVIRPSSNDSGGLASSTSTEYTMSSNNSTYDQGISLANWFNGTSSVGGTPTGQLYTATFLSEGILRFTANTGGAIADASISFSSSGGNISALNPVGAVSTVGSGNGIITITSTTNTDDDPNISVAITNGTNSTTTATTALVQDGIQGTDNFATSYRILVDPSHGSGVPVTFFPESQSSADSLTMIRDHFTNGDITGYTVGAITGNTFTVTSDAQQVESDITIDVIDGMSSSGLENGNTRVNARVTQQGLGTGTTNGGPQTWTVIVHGSNDTEYTFTGQFTEGINAAARAQEIFDVISTNIPQE